MKLSPTQATDLFETIFNLDDDDLKVSVKILKNLNLDINDIIESTNFNNFSDKYKKMYCWKSNSKAENSKNHNFLTSYFYDFPTMLKINEKNLSKILDNMDSSRASTSLFELCSFPLSVESIEAVPSSFIDKMLKLDEFKNHKNWEGNICNLLSVYMENVSFQKIKPHLINAKGTKRLFTPAQLKYIIEKSEVVIHTKKTKHVTSVVGQLVARAWFGPIDEEMNENLNLVFKKIKPAEIAPVLDDAISRLIDLDGIKILDKMGDALGLEWRSFIKEKHIRNWDKKLILHTLNQKNYVMPTIFKNLINRHEQRTEILKTLEARKIKEEKSLLIKSISKKPKSSVSVSSSVHKI